MPSCIAKGRSEPRIWSTIRQLRPLSRMRTLQCACFRRRGRAPKCASNQLLISKQSSVMGQLGLVLSVRIAKYNSTWRQTYQRWCLAATPISVFSAWCCKRRTKLALSSATIAVKSTCSRLPKISALILRFYKCSKGSHQQKLEVLIQWWDRTTSTIRPWWHQLKTLTTLKRLRNQPLTAISVP